MRELVISVEDTGQREALAGFLRERKVLARTLDARSMALDLDDGTCPALAVLVAELEAWRVPAGVGEAVLRLGGETRILRTEW